ncbi:MAG: hydroxyisourate hydrolase [Chloroflexi bacterium]|nr:hydroxyisourate hydrolase [Chloroflexota bacterium]
MNPTAIGPRVSTHVLDTATGRPAAGVLVRLEHLDGAQVRLLAEAETDASGRIADLVEGGIRPGWYRLSYDPRAYLRDLPRGPRFLGRVMIEFEAQAGEHHYHLPLLLAPYAATVYRGS